MATAPLRKCMPVVAGTPVIDSPTAWVTTSLPSTVTRTMAAFRCACAMVSRTMRITASALVASALEVGDSDGRAPGAQPVRIARAHNTARRRRTRAMPGSWQSDRAGLRISGIPTTWLN